MIVVNKGTEPPLLREFGQSWTRDWNAAMAQHPELDKVPEAVRSNLNHFQEDEILTALLAETHQKCAYCESCLTQDQVVVDHFIPPHVAPKSVYRWMNLLATCSDCHQAKADHNVLLERILNPSRQDPEKWFAFEGASFVPARTAPDPFAAERTIRVLNLNRPKLLEKRINHLQTLERMNPEGIDLVKAARADQPFAALARQVLHESLDRV